MTNVPRLRFAPSPTGPLHLGGARTALYNWAAARALGGKFLLRIEDTDRARSTDESLRIILEGLRWLGMDWDEGPEIGGDFGPYFQTERLATYRGYADKLLASGAAYRCYATPEEVEEGRQALQAAGQRPMYDRRHRDLTAEQRAAFEAEGRQPSLRFRMPLDETRAIDDLCKGRVEINLAELDDWVLVRPDGMPTYNFACVVDDEEMQISHVVRGEEHLMNGFKQLVLFESLGLQAPRFAHIPLILGKNGKKLSKRDAVTNVLAYRDQGYLPDAIFNAIALLGWTYSGDRDLFSRDEMLAKFKIEDIHSGGAKFDQEKLSWMNGEYLRRLSPGELTDAAAPWLTAGTSALAAVVRQSEHRAHLDNVVACYAERVTLLGELPGMIAFVYADTIELDGDAHKRLGKEANAGAWLSAYADRLAGLDVPPSPGRGDRGAIDAEVLLARGGDAAPEPVAGAMVPAALEADCRAFADQLGIKFGQFMPLLRAALFGTMKGAGVFDILFLIGKERALERLWAAVASTG